MSEFSSFPAQIQVFPDCAVWAICEDRSSARYRAAGKRKTGAVLPGDLARSERLSRSWRKPKMQPSWIGRRNLATGCNGSDRSIRANRPFIASLSGFTLLDWHTCRY